MRKGHVDEEPRSGGGREGRDPAVPEGYQGLARALKRSVLSIRLREEIALAIAAQTGCESCQAARIRAAAVGGLSSQEIAAASEGRSDDGEIAEILAQVALSLFTNTFTIVAGTPVDVRPGDGDPA
jgi:AhpD family alkylhydroperoxidase